MAAHQYQKQQRESLARKRRVKIINFQRICRLQNGMAVRPAGSIFILRTSISHGTQANQHKFPKYCRRRLNRASIVAAL